ncbi:hypothetical protein FRC00_005260 [Tulasnella sp. 408]|nr:hypothetical protein FRC00_005260 [Tulasnella sp. 408]
MIPLHQLPIEIFVLIITRALEPLRTFCWSRSTYLARLVRLCQVCKHWKDVIDDTPSLWTAIHVMDPAVITSTAISRSAGHPLYITAAPPDWLYRSPDGLDELINMAIPHSTRWRWLQVIVRSSEEALAIMNAPAPLLQTLDLKSTTQIRVGSQKGGAALGGDNPQLRRLGLYRVAIPWDSCLLRGLQHLSISELFSFAPSCGEILGILGACPGLVELKLSLYNAGAVEGPKRSTPFTLTELRSLSIYLDLSWTSALLETIRFPSVESVSLALNFNNSDFSDLPKLAQHIQALFPVVFKSQYEVLITITGSTCLCWEPRETTGGSREFKITAMNIPVPAAKECIVQTLLHRFPANAIEFYLNTTPYSHLWAILQEFDGVEGVNNIRANYSDLDAVLAYMSGPTTRDQWGFPELEQLSVFDCDYDPERLLSMVEARYGLQAGDGSDVADKNQFDLPPPFQLITICHKDGEADWDTLELVEDILGPGCHYFHERTER